MDWSTEELAEECLQAQREIRQEFKQLKRRTRLRGDDMAHKLELMVREIY